MPTRIHLPGVPHVFTDYHGLVGFLRSSPGYVGRQRSFLERYWPGALQDAGYHRDPFAGAQQTRTYKAAAPVRRAVVSQVPQLKKAVTTIPGIPHRAVERGLVRSPSEIIHHPLRQSGPVQQTGPFKGRKVVGTAGFPSPTPVRAIGQAIERAAAGRATRTITVGEKVQQFPRARSRITRAVIEKSADVVSRRYPQARILGAEARVAKAAGRETGAEAGRAAAVVAQHVKALPKEGSPEDVAHFWWAQLPKSHRNAAGLEAVRAKQAAELERVSSGKVLQSLRQQQKAITAKLNAGRAPKDPLKRAFAAYKREAAGEPDALDFEEFTARAKRHPEQLAHYFPDRKVVTEAVPEAPAGEAKGPTGRDRFDLMQQSQEIKLRISDLPRLRDDLGLSLAQLDKVIAKPPALNEKIVGAVHALSGDRRKVLEEAGLLKPDQAAARQGIVSHFVGVEPTGEEAFIGHRLDKVRGASPTLLPRSPGVGKVKIPQGVARENKLVLARQGRLRPSTRVAAEDWQAAQTYRQSMRARDDLAKMGKPFEGHLPDGYMLVNPKGRPVPPHWKTDHLAKLAEQGHDDQKMLKAAEEIKQGFLAGPEDAQKLIDAAKEQGVQWHELRVVPEKTVHRYYTQFQAPGRAGVAGRAYDAAVDATAASIIFARIGYVPKNAAQNIIMSVPHQGVAFFANMPRAMQILSDPELRHLVSAEVGVSGPTSSLGSEFTQTLRGIPGKAAQAVSGVADTPFRISAFLHEAAAEGVISRFNPVLDGNDREALKRLLTDETQRPKLNDIRSRSVEAMGDFSRMTPTQRRMARRFLIIPGWLWAGSRYPFHFAATHPIRSAALAYAAAGEPGAPDRLKLNKPVDEYFAKGLPSYIQGIPLFGGIARTTSLSPVNTPWDIGGALAGKNYQTAFDYANPLGAAAINIANRTVSGPSGPYRVPYGQAITQNLQRLAPSEKLVQDLISPPKAPKTYPEDVTRLGRLKREVGVIPIKITPVPGPHRDLTDAAALVKKLGVAKTLPPAVSKSLQRQSERDTAWQDAVSGKKRGTRDWYVARYKADIQLAQKWGYLTAAEAARENEWVAHAPIDDVRTAHSDLSKPGGMYDTELSPGRDSLVWLKAQQKYADALAQAVKAKFLTPAEAARERKWARDAGADAIDENRTALERELLAPAP